MRHILEVAMEGLVEEKSSCCSVLFGFVLNSSLCLRKKKVWSLVGRFLQILDHHLLGPATDSPRL
jgi:hypothetical protein